MRVPCRELIVLLLCCATGFLSASQSYADDPQGQRAAIGGVNWVLTTESHGPERGYQQLLVAGRRFGDFDLEAKLRRSEGITHFGIVFRFQDPDNLYRFVMRSGQQDFRVERLIAGVSDYAATRHIPFPNRSGLWYHVRLRVRGDKVVVFIDGTRLYEGTGFTEFSSGMVGVTVFDNAPADFRNFRVFDTNGKLLYSDDFDSGELSGWVAIDAPGVGGKWSVVKKGPQFPPACDFSDHRKITFLPVTPPLARLREFGNVVRLKNGELLAVWIEENQHGTPPWAAMPTCGRLMSLRSTDGGRTWKEYRVLVDTPIDDRHGYLAQLSDGTLLFIFLVQFTSLGVDAAPAYIMRSTDGGRTWDDPRRIRMPFPVEPKVEGRHCDPYGLFFTQPPLELPDGTLILPVFSMAKSGKGTRCFAARSYDKGLTWPDFSLVAEDESGTNNYCEPSIAVAPSGRWICVMRDEIYKVPGNPFAGYTLAPTHWCVSDDEGRTWSAPEPMPTGFPGEGSGAPCIITTTEGILVFANARGVAFSWDSGKTWVPQMLNLGYYPVLTAMPGGRVMSFGAQANCQFFTPTPAHKPDVSGQPPIAASEITTPDIPTVVMPVASKTLQAAPRPVGPLNVLRLSGPTAFGGERLVAAYYAEGGHVCAAWSSDGGASWDGPSRVAKGGGSARSAQLAELPDRSVICTFALREGRLAWSRSTDAGRTWSTPTQIALEDSPSIHGGGALVVESDSGWRIPVWTDDGGDVRTLLLRTSDGGRSWNVAGPALDGYVEPALLVMRSGQQRLFARRAGTPKIVCFTSPAGGQRWDGPEELPIDGVRPAPLELAEGIVLVAAQGNDGRLDVAYTWPDMNQWFRSYLACGYAVPVGGKLHLAQGTGLGLNGNINNLAQVPLTNEQQEAWLGSDRLFIDDTDGAFAYSGPWEEIRDGRAAGGGYHVGSKGASVKVGFTGTAVGLVFTQAPRYGLLQVVIDGREYPPVETTGPEAFQQRRCLALGLAPGNHELSLRVLMYGWKNGQIRIDGIETAQ